jgi:transcriptional regulator with XRE-family HTH domain
VHQRAELGDFLRSRRARIGPDEAGVPHHGRRRVPGLRREELASLAGISVGYYTRLEQGARVAVSGAVVDAVARALRLDRDEWAHLRRLAGVDPVEAGGGAERLRDGVRLLVESMGHLPALVLGRVGDVLAWTPSAHALLAGHLPFDPPERPNWTRLFFLDPRVRALFADWSGKAWDTVADLRAIAGRYPDDARVAGLVADVSRASPEFRALWDQHPVRRCAHHARRYRHPVVGELTLTDELLTLPDDDGQRLVVFNAEPGSSSAAALTLLAELAAGRAHLRRGDRETGWIPVAE